MTTVSARLTKHQLGQLTRLDLLALALRRNPRGPERRYGQMTKDGLIDLLTRRKP